MTERVFNEIKANDQTKSALLSRQRFQYDINAKINDSFDEGIEIGTERGKLEAQVKMAVKLLKKNMDIATIAELSELTEDEVFKLKSKSEI